MQHFPKVTNSYTGETVRIVPGWRGIEDAERAAEEYVKPIPEGFELVSKTDFYETVGSLDVHPSSTPYRTIWKLRRGKIVGLTLSGYRYPAAPSVYYRLADYPYSKPKSV